MAPEHDPDHPSKRKGHSIYVEPAVWKQLRLHALAEGVPATGIVAALITEYVNWPPALQAATLRKVRTADEADPTD